MPRAGELRFFRDRPTLATMTKTTLSAQLVSIQVGMPQYFEDSEKAWTSGIIKTPIEGQVTVFETGLTGDGQADLKNHGGVDKAVLVYCQDHFTQWQLTFPNVDWQPGAFGENLTLKGMSERDVCIGDVWAIGDCQLEVSQPRQPCWKLSRRWNLPKLAVQVQQTRRTGWYLRVRVPGIIKAPTEMQLIERPYPEMTIDWANQVMYAKPRVRKDDLQLANCPALAESWQEHLLRRQTDRSL